MDIKLAKKENIDDLYRLWNICFADDKKTIDMFFKNSFELTNTVVCIDKDKVISMAFLVPEVIISNYNEYSAYYLYALATDVSYRKKGIMAKMLEYISDLATQRDIDYLFLVPASNNLFDYYRNNGYQNAFNQKKLTMSSKTLDKLKSFDCLNEIEFNSKNYKDVKKKNIMAINGNSLEKSFVDWRRYEVELAKDYFLSSNGETICTQYGSCFIEHDDNCDRIYDLNCDENKILEMLSNISNHIIGDEIEFYLSKNYCLIGNNQIFYNCGMIKKLKPNLDDLENTFMGITLQ